MAATIRTVGTPAFGVTGTITPTVPTYQPGDILLLILGSSANASTTPTHSPPAGWTSLLRSEANSTGTTRARCSIYWKRAVASEGNPGVTVTPTGNTACHHSAVILAIQDADQSSSPFDSNNGGGQTAGASSQAVNITTQYHDELCILAVHHADNIATGATNNGGYTEDIATDNSTGIDGFLYVAHEAVASAGANNCTVTFTSGGTGVGIAGVSIAIKSAGTNTVDADAVIVAGATPVTLTADADSVIAQPKTASVTNINSVIAQHRTAPAAGGSISRDGTFGTTPKVATKTWTTSTTLDSPTFDGGSGGVWTTARVSWGAGSSVGTPTVAWQGTAPSGNTGWESVCTATFTGSLANYSRVTIFRCWCPNSFTGAQVRTTRGTGTDSSDAFIVVDVWAGGAADQSAAVSGTRSGGSPGDSPAEVSVTLTKTATSHLIVIGIDHSNIPSGPRLTTNANTTAETGGYFDDHAGVGLFDTAYYTSDAASGSVTVGFTENHIATAAAAMELLPAAGAGLPVNAVIAAQQTLNVGASAAILDRNQVFADAIIDINNRIQVHASGRYLLRDGQPYWFNGENIWFAAVNATEAVFDEYCADRASRKFSTVTIMALVHNGYYTSNGWVDNAPAISSWVTGLGGTHPWANTADKGDFSKLNATANGFNPNYWDHLDALIRIAVEDYDLVVQIVPCYSGYGRYLPTNGNCQGWYGYICDSGTTKYSANTQQAMYDYGAWLATRWASWIQNIIWFGDGDSCPESSNTEGIARLVALRNGVRDTFPGAIWMAETDGAPASSGGMGPDDGTSTPSDYTPYEDDLDIESFYGLGDDADTSYFSKTPHRAWGQTVADNVPRPALVTEPRYAYEQENITRHRLSLWNSFLGGGTAGLNASAWPIYAGPHDADGTYWSNYFGSGYDKHRLVMRNILETMEWWKLEPRTVDSGTGWEVDGPEIISSGVRAGNYRIIGATTSDGKSGVVYVPDNRAAQGQVTFSVDMTLYAGNVMARWVNPLSGTATLIGTYANTGTQSFTTPGGWTDEDSDTIGVSQTSYDWLLVFLPVIEVYADAIIIIAPITASLSESLSASETLAEESAGQNSWAETSSATEVLKSADTITRSLAETQVSTDTVASGETASAVLSETISTTDFYDYAYLQHGEGFTETVSATETINGITGATLSENVSASEGLVGKTTGRNSWTESNSETEALKSADIITRNLAETLAAADALASSETSSVGMSETVTSTEAVAYAETDSAGITESVSATETLLGGELPFGSLTESSSAIDSLNSAETAFTNLSETVNAVDSLSHAEISSSGLSETATPTELLARLKTTSGALVETISASAALSHAETSASSFSESITVTASVSIPGAQAYDCELAENIVTSEALAVDLRLKTSEAETASAQDSVASAAVIKASATETVSTSDVYIRGAVSTGAFAESTAAAESLDSNIPPPLALSESVNATESFSVRCVYQSQLAESVDAGTVFASSGANLQFSVSEDLDSTETVSAGLVLQASIAESSSAAVSISSEETDFVAFSESANSTSEFDSIVFYGDGITENVAATHSESTAELGLNTIVESVSAVATYRVPSTGDKYLQESVFASENMNWVLRHRKPPTPIIKESSILYLGRPLFDKPKGR